MKKYRAIYCLIEHRIEIIKCEANSEEEAKEKFDAMIDDTHACDFEEMKCIHAEDYIQDVEEII
jgi:hypothetical protein